MEIKLKNLISHEESTTELDSSWDGCKEKGQNADYTSRNRCGKHYELKYSQGIGLS